MKHSAHIEPSQKSLDWAQKHRDAFMALIRVGYSRKEALYIMSAEPWHRVLFETEE